MQTTLFKKDKNAGFKYVNGNIMKINAENILDQYFTKEEIAENLLKTAKKIISDHEIDLNNFKWIDPSAGNGVFFNLLPKNKIGIDINPMCAGIVKQDFLKYNISKKTKNIVIGNPPFGHRGVTALKFINHSKNADYVCFILPMFFESKGKGSIKHRVDGLHLIHSERLPKNSFYTLENYTNVDVKCVFQVWSRKNKIESDEFNWYKNRKNEPFNDLIKVFTVSLAKNRECGKHWIYEEKADFYISSTFHGNTSIVDTFEEVKYKSGVAIVITTKNKSIKGKITKIFKKTDWSKYGSLATNSCYHIGKSNIFQVMQDNINRLQN